MPIHNPKAVCPKCDKEYTIEGAVIIGTVEQPIKRVCDSCRRKMPHTTVTIAKWPDGHTETAGECTICNQFPCEHCPPDVDLDLKPGKAYDIKIYEARGKDPKTRLFNVEELETIRNLTYAQKTTIEAVLLRHGIKYFVKKLED